MDCLIRGTKQLLFIKGSGRKLGRTVVGGWCSLKPHINFDEARRWIRQVEDVTMIF